MAQTSNTARTVEVVAVAVAMAAMALAMTGCETGDWDDPDYVVLQLEEGSTTQQHQAISQLRHIPDDYRAEAAAVASELYLDEPRMRSDIMQRLIEWRLPEATDAYLEEVAGDHAGYGAAAARTLGEMEAEETIPELIEIFGEIADHDRQAGILRGLSHMPDDGALDHAVEVLELDVDNFPIELHRSACYYIGALAAEQPEAITDEVRYQLAYARMLMSESGGTVDEACGLAIQQIGHPMIPELRTLFDEEHEEVSQLLMMYDDPLGDEHFTQNEAKETAVEHLSAMRAPEAVELYIEELETEVEEPDLVSASAPAWRHTQSSIINEMLFGLGDIGDPEARPVLERVVQGDTFGDEWEVLMTPAAGFQMLQDAARALARLGDRDARSTLLEMTDAEIFPPMARAFEAAEDGDDPVPLTEQLRPQWLAAQAYAYLGEADDRSDIESLADDIEDEDLSEKLESFLVAFDVMDECEDIGDESERAECFGEFLEHDEEHAREKAALELSRMSPEAAGPVVADAIDTDDLELRETLTFAAYRVPAPELSDRVAEILDAESGEGGSEYQADHHRLRMLYAWLENQDAEDVVTN